MTPPPIPANAERGALFLDLAIPDWEDKIDLRDLDLSQGCKCVLGQINPAGARLRQDRFDRALDALGLGYQDAARLGFIVWGRQRYDMLTAGWRRLIEARRAAREV
jgi:hypothetical protein